MSDYTLDLAALDALTPDQRREAMEALGKWRKEHQSNPLWRWRPHEVQFPFLSSRKRTKMFIGGNRAGKTTAGVADDVIQCVDADVLPEHLRPMKKWEPPFFCYVVTRDFKASHQVIVEKFKALTPMDQLRGGSWRSAYDRQDMRLWFRNGSWVQFMSQQQEVDAFGGVDLHRVHFDEEPNHDHGLNIFRECRVRLWDHQGDCVMTMTPQHGMSWVFDQLYLPWERGERPGLDIFTASTSQNPHLDRGDKEALAEERQMYSQEELQAREHGRFVAFEGLIYPEWDPLRHVIPQGVVEHPIYMVETIDPSDMRNAAGVLWLAVEPAPVDGEDRRLPVVTVVGEWKQENATIDVVCDGIFEMRSELGVKPSWSVIDPAARNRKAQTGKSDQAAYAERGIFCRPGNNARNVGFSRVRALLQHDRLFAMANCTEFRDEMRRYRWTTPRRSEHAPKAEPVKRNDHLVDPLRYGVLSIPGLEPPSGERTAFQMREDRVAAEIHELAAQVGVDPSAFGPGFFS